MRLCLVALLAALGLSACVSSPADPVVITELIKPELPDGARDECASPSYLPEEGGLSEAEVFNLWAFDRIALKVCEVRRAAAVNAVDAAPEEHEMQGATGEQHGT